MMKQNSVCLRFRFIFVLLPNVTGVYTLLGYTRSRLVGSWLYTLQFIARWWKKEKRKLYKWPTVCVYNGSSLSFVDSRSWQNRLVLLADWVILFVDFTTKYQCELLTFWEASSNTPHCVLSDNPKKTLKFVLEKLGGVSFFNLSPDVWLSDETLLNVIHFSVFENKWNTR